jgi:hypothetical protein
MGKEEADKFTNVHLDCMNYRYLYELDVSCTVFGLR